MGKVKVFLLLLSLIMMIVAPLAAEASPNQTDQLRVAFIRDGNLWIKAGEKEVQLTKTGGISGPKWSNDGNWIAYRKASSFADHSIPVSRQRNIRHLLPASSEELWVCRVDRNQHYRISFQGKNTEWAPDKNILAFQDDTVLNTADLTSGAPRSFQNRALGVSSYSWLPNGAGFLASSTANLLPDGWTNPLLYQISLKATLENKLVRRFFTIPAELQRGETKILSIGTTPFSWSSTRDWIAFIVYPTASWSADSDMLCVLSSDGKSFAPVAEMLAYLHWVKWAPEGNVLAYIEGGGRLATENKRLTIRRIEKPVSQRLTPAGFADGDFTWQTPSLITVSRVKESGWSVQSHKRPKPSLYQIDINHPQNQKKVTEPLTAFGDYNPLSIKKAKLLTWIRAGKMEASIWLANADGTDAKEYVKGIGLGKGYYEMRDWSNAVDWYRR